MSDVGVELGNLHKEIEDLRDALEPSFFLASQYVRSGTVQTYMDTAVIGFTAEVTFQSKRSGETVTLTASSPARLLADLAQHLAVYNNR